MVQTKFFIQYNKPKIEIQQIFSYIMLKLFGNLQNLNVYVNCLFHNLEGNKIKLRNWLQLLCIKK